MTDTIQRDRTPLTRRQAIGAAGAIGAGAVLAQLSGPGRLLEAIGIDEEAQAATASCVLTPSKTEGPYFVDEHLTRSDIRVDTSDGSVQAGVPLTLTLVVVRADGDCAPVAGAVVDVWHANAGGLYSDVANAGPGGSQAGRKYLRGNQTTDANGQVTFTTVYPGWYSGRAIHIHYKVRLYDGASKTYEFTSQLFFDPSVTAQVVTTSAYVAKGTPDTANGTDSIYGSDGAKLVVPLSGSTGAGFAGTFVAGLSGLPATAGTTTTTTDTTVGARLSSVRFRRTTAGRRIMRLRIVTTETARVHVRLTRSGQRLLARTLTGLAAGTHTLDVRIPSAAARGKATLTLTFTDSNGNTKSTNVSVTVPRRHL